MKRFASVVAVLIIGLLPLLSLVSVYAAEPAKIVISQFKVTTQKGQFFMLYNNTDDPIDMGTVQLVYFNNYNLSSATSSKVIGLSGELKPRSYYLVNDGPYTLCYQMVVNSLSLGLSTTAGTVVVQTLLQNQSGGPITTVQHDSVSWSKAKVAGIQQLPADDKHLIRQPVDAQNNPAVTQAGSGSWVEVAPKPDDPCVLVRTIVNQPPSVIETSLLLLSSTPPPVTIISTVQSAQETSGPFMPASNIGLMAPVVNELLANPGSPKLDANDEFIELYNPNDKQFDLSGFYLQVGLTTKRIYKIPAGTTIKPKSFRAFYSDQTNLALTNTGGMAELLDPFKNSISKSDDYASAKDNQAWALANNDWLLTTSPTPDKANVITGDQGQGGAAGSNSAGRSGTNNQRLYTGTAQNGDVLGKETQARVADIHPNTLAGVAALAVGYGAYEYRSDVANKFRAFSEYRAGRRKARG